MIRTGTALFLIALLGACNDGQPFEFPEDVDAEDITDQSNEEEELVVVPDEESEAFALLDDNTRLGGDDTSSSANSGIERQESINTDEGASGGGFLASATYAAATDTFVVDGLGFDGENVYDRSTDIPTLNGYRVFEADLEAPDFLTGAPIDQIAPYRAIYGVSDSTVNGAPQTSFAIVRTGGYVNYGFGGFIIQREGGVDIPSTGQAQFTGDYAGVRVFSGLGGIEYTTGDMQVAIDFEDFNTNDAVLGRLTNRQAFDINGAPIALGDAADGDLELPTLTFTVQGGQPSLLETGEMAGTVNSFAVGESGGLEQYEEGNYYAIVSGDLSEGNGGEIVGVMVFESDDPRFTQPSNPNDPTSAPVNTVQVQETGGFIVYRDN